mmetsp:Transcript_56773/g.182371  ORF Transcript_56773/g.182371 Transcript_56773/m.182371 type:complete len:200 (-) Transcript_56773:245-844(-)
MLPKNTAPTSDPSLAKKTTETSRSTSLPAAGETSQPRPAKTCLAAEDCGRSMTAPFSIAKATFCLFGALGMMPRMRLPMVGSRMSMKCWPLRAGSSMTRRLQSPPAPFTIMATASTSAGLCSSPKTPTSLPLLSSMRWILPFLASLRWPRLKAATTKTMSLTYSGSLFMVTHTTSSSPSFSPVFSSPECVTAFKALRLL